MRVTVSQFDPRPGHLDDAMAALADHVRSEGSDVVLLPEMSFADWLTAALPPSASSGRTA